MELQEVETQPTGDEALQGNGKEPEETLEELKTKFEEERKGREPSVCGRPSQPPKKQNPDRA